MALQFNHFSIKREKIQNKAGNNYMNNKIFRKEIMDKSMVGPSGE